MRLAYLITAYDQPEHLQRLVNALAAPGCEFHIHIDARVALAPFEEPLRDHPNVHFVPDRVRIQWMGFSQVESILKLLAQAQETGFDYCVLLSGSDYPIKSNSQIRAFYENASEEFMTFWRLEDRPSWAHKIQYWYPIDLIPIWGHSKGREPVYWRRLFWGRFYKYRRHMPRRRFPFAMVPYGGSDWWSLSGGCVREILDFVARNPRYGRFYRHTHCPSEMFFHTIVLNSSYATRVRNAAAYRAWSMATSPEQKASEACMLKEDDFNLRYIDWSREREAPAILDDRDWEPLRRSHDLFARKFDSRISAGLLDRADAELLREPARS